MRFGISGRVRLLAVAAFALVCAAAPPAARAIYWNNDPAFGATSANGLTDRVDWFQNTHVIYNETNNSRGTTTLLNKEWAITVRHVVQNGSDYGVIAPASSIYVDVLGTRYYGDRIFAAPSSAELALVHLRGGVNAALDATGIINTNTSEGNRYVHVGGYGYWGILSTANVTGTASGAVTFHRAYNIAQPPGGQIQIVANADTALVNNGLLEGIAGPGDSGGPMFGWYGAGVPTAASNMNDWRLIGLTATSAAGASGGSWGQASQYTRISSFASFINSTRTSLAPPGPTTTGPWIQNLGSNLYDTGGDKFSVTGSNAAPALHANFGPGGAGYTLNSVGDRLSFSAVLDTTLNMADIQFRYGMYDDAGGTIPGNVTGGAPWRGYYIANSVEGLAARGAFEKGPSGGGVGSYWSQAAPNTAPAVGVGTVATGTYDDAAGNQTTPGGRYDLSLEYTRVATGLKIDWAMQSIDALGAVNGVYSHTGSVIDATPASSNWNYNQIGLFLLGGAFTGTIIVDDVNVAFTEFVPQPGDFNEDGAVDAGDLTAWQAGFGKTSGALHTEGDANNDGAVDGADLLVWQQQLGAMLTAAPLANPEFAAVPEAGTPLLACFALAALMVGYRGSRHGACLRV